MKILRERKAQVGIGTLIVFIAMILVAAVAAGTVLRTSGVLEFKARSTSELVTKEVSTNLRVLEIVGYTGYSNNTQGTNITKLILTISLAPGSSDIRYSDIVLSFQSGNTYIRGIRYNSSVRDTEANTSTDDDVADFGVVLLNTVTADEVLERTEIIELHLWIEDGAQDYQIGSNQEFYVTLMPVGSTPLEYGRIAPSGINSLYIKRWT